MNRQRKCKDIVANVFVRGLDPATRRDVWKVINSAVKSPERCVMLTTHSMEEAEALCNRVGIMHRGNLKSVGTLTHLKSQLGSGYKITINVEPTSPSEQMTSNEETERRVTQFVLSMLSQSALEYSSNLFFIFRVHHIDLKLSELFKKMDSQVTRQRYKLSREDGFVLNWSVNSASLEELFFKVVKPNILTLNQM
jgi:ABC-type multidrug transport system ATPase subunit